MRNYLIELGVELSKSSPVFGALILDLAGAFTLTNIGYVLLVLYAGCQLGYLIWKWRRERALHHIHIEQARLERDVALQRLKHLQEECRGLEG